MPAHQESKLRSIIYAGSLLTFIGSMTYFGVNVFAEGFRILNEVGLQNNYEYLDSDSFMPQVFLGLIIATISKSITEATSPHPPEEDN